jgi:hypothetical protein
MKKLSAKIVMPLLTCLVLTAHAADKGGNGGDICEDRIKLVRDDIATWIKKSGSAGLTLPSGISVTDYNSAMSAQMQAAQISCVGEPVMVGTTEKTCKNFVASNGTPQIVCNFDRFNQTAETEQYVLVHHEYAGLAGIEVNIGDSSNYPVSNQISEYLQTETVQKLTIKKKCDFQANARSIGEWLAWDVLHGIDERATLQPYWYKGFDADSNIVDANGNTVTGHPYIGTLGDWVQILKDVYFAPLQANGIDEQINFYFSLDYNHLGLNQYKPSDLISDIPAFACKN